MTSCDKDWVEISSSFMRFTLKTQRVDKQVSTSGIDLLCDSMSPDKASDGSIIVCATSSDRVVASKAAYKRMSAMSSSGLLVEKCNVFLKILPCRSLFGSHSRFRFVKLSILSVVKA